MEIFRTNTEYDGLASVDIFSGFFDRVGLSLGKRDFVACEFHIDGLSVGSENCVEEVHLRSADEACNEKVCRIIVKFLRSVDLLNVSVFHNDYSRSHRHCFDLIVSNVNEGGCKSVMKFGYFGSHLSAEFRVEVGKGFVEKEYLRFADDRSSERDPLSLTAGKSLRLSLEITFKTEDSCGSSYFFVDFRLGFFTELKTERHIVVYGHVRIKSIVLENHRYISVLGLNVVHKLSVNVKLAVRNLFKTRYHTKRCRLSATGRSYEHDEFLIFDVQTEIRYGNDARGINFVNVFQIKTCHFFLLNLSVLTVSITYYILFHNILQ